MSTPGEPHEPELPAGDDGGPVDPLPGDGSDRDASPPAEGIDEAERPDGPEEEAASPAGSWSDTAHVNTALAALLGLIALTGAVLTGRAALIDQEAKVLDRQAVVEVTILEMNTTEAHIAAAAELRESAGAAVSASESETLVDLAGSGPAEQQPELAAEMLRRSLLLGSDPDAGHVSFDDVLERHRGEDIFIASLDPQRTLAAADAMHARSVEVSWWVVALAVVLVVVTVARVTRGRARFPLAVGGAAAYLLIAAIAVVRAWSGVGHA